MQNAVSSDYIRALILTESAAQKYAVSNKGARGLTQIMPETGRLAISDILAEGFDYEYVDEEKLASYNADHLYDPCVNILIACYLGARYHADYSGRSDLSAAAWNAGPEAVAKYGNRIPAYRETRGMVARLVGYLNYLSAYPVSSTQPGQVPTVASAGVNWSDLSHSRWDTKGWTDPGWDEKKVNWEIPF
jgi:soluble lytic murein transglycosylase-like protein